MVTTDIPGAKLGLYKTFAAEQNPNLDTGYWVHGTKRGQIVWNYDTGEDDVVSSHKDATKEIDACTWTSIMSLASCAGSILKPGSFTKQ